MRLRQKTTFFAVVRNRHCNRPGFRMSAIRSRGRPARESVGGTARILPSMDRDVLLDHVRRTRLPHGRRAQARSDARRVAEFLRQHGARRVVGFGSAFASDRRFTWRSDIDVAVVGLKPEDFFAVSAGAADMTDFALDIVPIESATEAMRHSLLEEGVEL